MTLQAIADADGTVSHMTIQRALEDDSDLTNVNSAPTIISKTGKDGTVSEPTVRRSLNDDRHLTNVPPTVTDTKGRKQPTKKPSQRKMGRSMLRR